MSNEEVVGRALKLLNQGLVPFIARAMFALYETRYETILLQISFLLYLHIRVMIQLYATENVYCLVLNN
jgi:hypothetical protein